MQKPPKILVFGDDYERMKDLCKRLRHEGYKAETRSIHFFQGCLERCDAVYMLERADHIAEMYQANGIEVMLLMETPEAEQDQPPITGDDSKTDPSRATGVEPSQPVTQPDPPVTPNGATAAQPSGSRGKAKR